MSKTIEQLHDAYLQADLTYHQMLYKHYGQLTSWHKTTPFHDNQDLNNCKAKLLKASYDYKLALRGLYQ